MPKPLYPPPRPQSISEVLDAGFKIFATSLLQTLPYGMLITLAGQLGNIYNLATGQPVRRLVPRDPTWWLLYVVSVIVSIVLWAALILRQRAIAQGQPVSMRAELSIALRRLADLTLLSILNGFAVVGGLVLLIVPGLYLFVALLMAVPALLFENMSPVAALKRSVELVRGNWWRTLGIFLVAFCIMLAFLILGGVVTAVVVQLERGVDIAVVTATSTVLIISLGAFSTPYLAANMLAIFGDLQARRAAAPVVA